MLIFVVLYQYDTHFARLLPLGEFVQALLKHHANHISKRHCFTKPGSHRIELPGKMLGQAGIQVMAFVVVWIPAFAGMTKEGQECWFLFSAIDKQPFFPLVIIRDDLLSNMSFFCNVDFKGFNYVLTLSNKLYIMLLLLTAI